MTEDEMVGWHHQLSGYGFEQAPGDGEGQGSLACCSPWGGKELDLTERLNSDTPLRAPHDVPTPGAPHRASQPFLSERHGGWLPDLCPSVDTGKLTLPHGGALRLDETSMLSKCKPLRYSGRFGKSLEVELLGFSKHLYPKLIPFPRSCYEAVVVFCVQSFGALEELCLVRKFCGLKKSL